MSKSLQSILNREIRHSDRWRRIFDMYAIRIEIASEAGAIEDAKRIKDLADELVSAIRHRERETMPEHQENVLRAWYREYEERIKAKYDDCA